MALVATLLLVIGYSVDDNTDDHLRDLSARDDNINPFGDSIAERAHPVVRVHGCMNGEVHKDKPATRGAKVFARVPAVDEDGCVVVPVEKDELLFAHHNEHRVDKFRYFA